MTASPQPFPWHCTDADLRRYTRGRAASGETASVETHLLRCARCRTALADGYDAAPVDLVWSRVRAIVHRPPLPVLLRLLRRCGLDERDAVLLSASQSLRGPWTLATVLVLVLAVAAAVPGDRVGDAVYLLIAPLVPVLGVVAAFARPDATSEMAVTTPYSKPRLALLRTFAVTATTVPLVVAMTAALPGIGWMSVAWLGPALVLTLAALVALTWWTPEVTAVVVTTGWAAVVTAAYTGGDLADAVGPAAQPAYLGLAAFAAVLLIVRIRFSHAPGGYA